MDTGLGHGGKAAEEGEEKEVCLGLDGLIETRQRVLLSARIGADAE